MTKQLSLQGQNNLTAACQLNYKFSTTAKVGILLKINSTMPTIAKGYKIHWHDAE